MRRKLKMFMIAGALCLACFGCEKKDNTVTEQITETTDTKEELTTPEETTKETTKDTTEDTIKDTTEKTTEETTKEVTEETTITTEENSQGDGLGTVKVGDKVTFGRYEQDNDFDNESESLVWRVLAIEDGTAIMITDEGIDCQKFHEFFNEAIEWENSDIRYWLNINFFRNAFSDEEAQLIQDDSTGDRVSMLTADEAQTYFAADSDRICHITTYAAFLGAGRRDEAETDILPEYSSWWLRSPGFMGGWVAYVTSSGTIVTDHGEQANFANNAVRPVIRVKLSGLNDSVN